MIFGTIPMVMNFSGGMELLDMKPMGYDATYVKTLFDNLGREGRDLYLYRQIPVDMFYPGLFGLTYGLALAFFLKKLDKFNSPFYYLCLLPFLAGLADYLENAAIVLLLQSYPALADNLVSFSNGATLVKSVATSVVFTVLVIVLLFVALRRSSARGT
jgi:hypothetical protein